MNASTIFIRTAVATLLIAAPVGRALAATVVADGFYPQISGDGLSLYYWSSFNRSPESRIKRILATSTDVAAPLPAIPYSHRDDWAPTPSERYLAYSSYDDLNLSPYDNNEQGDIYLFDTVTSTNELVSRTNAGGIGYGGFSTGSERPSLSSDGRYVVFLSQFSNLVAGDTNGTYEDIFVRDRCISNGSPVPSCTPTTELVSRGPTGNQSAYGADLQYAGGSQSISADGRFVVFTANGDLDPSHDCGGGFCYGAFVRDRCISNGTPVPSCTPSTEMVSLTPAGNYPHSSVTSPVISADGSRVAYESTSTDITADPEPNSVTYDVFLYDRNTHVTRRLSTPPATGEDVLGGTGSATISADGLRVAWSLNTHYTIHDITMWADCPLIGATCGDGALEPGCEECDDGDLIDGDGCDSNCTLTTCGNGITTTGEGCDDGAFVDGDGCDSNCTVTACGNDIRTTGEICDDANTANGDGCSSSCSPEPGELTPGGKGKTDCEFEFLPRPQPIKKKNIPAAAVICKDDDPSCDLGGEPGDKLCVFRVAFCGNVTDPRFACTPIDLTGAIVSAPKIQDFDSPKYDYITDFNRGSVEYNLQQLGASYTGRCTAPPINVGADCLENVDCDETEGDGKCTKPLFEFNPPVTTTNVCTDYADFVVALKEPKPGIFKKASMSIKLKTFASNDPIKLKPRNSDSDGLKLICLP